MLDQLVHALVAVLLAIAAVVLAALAWVEAAFTNLMVAAHVPHNLQSVLAIIIAVLVLIAALRLFGGFVRVVLIVLLLALVAHAVLHHTPLEHPSPAIHT